MSDIRKQAEEEANKYTWLTYAGYSGDPNEIYRAYIAGHSFAMAAAGKEIEELKKEIERLKYERMVTLQILEGGKTDAYEKVSNVIAYLNH